MFKTCERCGHKHQRMFKCYNGQTEKDEDICGGCIIDIWGGVKVGWKDLKTIRLRGGN